MSAIFCFNNRLLDYLPAFGGEYGPFLTILSVSAIVAFLLYIILFYLLRLLFRQWQTDLPLLILNVSRSPILAIVILLGLKLSLEELGATVTIDWIQRGVTATIVVFATYLIAQLFTQVAVYYLRSYAKKTEAVWDDVLVPILERLIPALTYLLGTFFFLQTLGIDLTGLWVAFGGLTFVLGFALRDILGNFFSGLVLLIDTPFQFGDVISMPNGKIAVIKNIGLRVTELYMIDNDCEVYMPNASLGSINIVNLTRPTPHFATSINVAVTADADQMSTTTLLKEAVLGHPDTLGDIDEKLQSLESFQDLEEVEEEQLSKKEAGHLRLLAEKNVNNQLQKIEQEFKQLIEAIKVLEKGGLTPSQIAIVQKDYEQILELVGLEIVEEDNKWGKSQLEEVTSSDEQDTLINLIRLWYQAWLKDPNLKTEDQEILVDEWESKLDILKLKMNKLLEKVAKPGGDETRLDDYSKSVLRWLRENFKESQSLWKEPKIRLEDVKGSAMEFAIKFYVDHIKLERWDRGYRVSNEVRREVVRRLKEADIYSS
ncbi:MAG: mechanosensitive ion channel [Symploca sp. SIO2C1]|nr:mechanosensitive ion channel [Symploca sp. SIO2C1]